MKKTTKILSLILAYFFVLQFTACGETPCKHNYVSATTKEATCLEKGIKTYTCTLCSNSYIEDIEKTNTHTYVRVTTKEATCQEKGIETYTCTTCSKSYMEDIAKLSTHNYISKITKEATCTEKGIRTYTCNGCGDSYTEDIAKSSTHSYSSKITKQATCKEKGVKTYTCNVCGDSYTEDIAKLTTHSYTSKVTKEATCQENGVIKYSCSICGDYYTETKTLTEKNATEVFEATKNTVCEIITYDKNGTELALGTGFAYSKDGKVITNYHVIEDAHSVKVSFGSTSYTTDVVLAYDKDIDLVVLKISATNLPVVEICKQPHAVGKSVYAIGSSKGLTETFSQGIITYADRDIDGVHYVQHDAAISSGNSGGPLVNSYGEIIGINTMSVKDSQNLNFAISVKEIDNLSFASSVKLSELFAPVKADPFTSLKNYAIAKGTYSDGDYEVSLKSFYSSDYKTKYTIYLTYDVSDNEINLQLYADGSFDYLIGFTIDSSVNGNYVWTYVDTYGYYMGGILYANTFTDNSLLGYSSTNASSSTRTTLRKLASTAMIVLCIYLDEVLAPAGVTAVDLGFYYF